MGVSPVRSAAWGSSSSSHVASCFGTLHVHVGPAPASVSHPAAAEVAPGSGRQVEGGEDVVHVSAPLLAALRPAVAELREVIAWMGHRCGGRRDVGRAWKFRCTEEASVPCTDMTNPIEPTRAIAAVPGSCRAPADVGHARQMWWFRRGVPHIRRPARLTQHCVAPSHQYGSPPRSAPCALRRPMVSACLSRIVSCAHMLQYPPDSPYPLGIACLPLRA